MCLKQVKNVQKQVTVSGDVSYFEVKEVLQVEMRHFLVKL